MPHSVCPWWLGYLLASPLRKLLYSPAAVVGPHVQPGMTVVEPGPGMGYFTLELARLVGDKGRVIAVDIQPKMLDALRRRANKAGVGARIATHLAAGESMGLADLAGAADFLLAFAVVHELPSAEVFFAEAAATLKRGGHLLLAEPSGHVKGPAFDAELQLAANVGFQVQDRPAIWQNHTALLLKR